MAQHKKNGSGVMGIREAADYLEVHESTIYRLAGSGEIPAVKLGGQWRFKKDVIDQWLTNEMQRNAQHNHRERKQTRP